AAKIVQRPWLQRSTMVRLSDARVELGLSPRVVLVAAPNGRAEDVLPGRAISHGSPGKRLKDRQRRLRQRDEVLASVLGARGGKCQGGGLEIDLVKENTPALSAAPPGCYKELTHRPEVTVVGRHPDGPQFVVGEPPPAPAVLVRLVGEGDRISVEVTLARQ